MAWRVFKKGPNHKKWTVEGRDHLGVKRQLPAYRDVALSNELAKSVAIIVDHKRHNTPLPPLLAEWVQNLAPDIRDRLASYGLLESHTRPLSEHLDDYKVALTCQGQYHQSHATNHQSHSEDARRLQVSILVRYAGKQDPAVHCRFEGGGSGRDP